ncbi:MAG: flagellar hook-basal body complex protein, partial [Oscillospiraceae bacterium]
MLKSLFSGVAGLKTHQTKMDVIGNNIANVNTYGFKSSRATYKDVFYQTLNASSDATTNLGGGNSSQVGYGSMINSIDVLHSRAGYTPTGRSMDAFINGEGYFIARDGAGNESYTRVGILGFDGKGNLVDANKRYICGYPIQRDASGKIEYVENTPVGGKGNNKGLTVDFGTANGDKMKG